MTLLDHLPSNVLHPPSSVFYSFSVCASIRLTSKMTRFASGQLADVYKGLQACFQVQPTSMVKESKCKRLRCR